MLSLARIWIVVTSSTIFCMSYSVMTTSDVELMHAPRFQSLFIVVDAVTYKCIFLFSGVISVAVTKLDHEVHPYYTLVLRAQEDQTPAASVVTTLAITITNENEFPPVFSMTTYTTSISENTLIGGVVLLVEATDDDSVSFEIMITL